MRESPLERLPPELLLDIIPMISYDPLTLTFLCLTCRKFKNLIKKHELSLTKEAPVWQTWADQVALFPGLPCSSWRDLAHLQSRIYTLDGIHKEWPRITGHSTELKWLRGRWESVSEITSQSHDIPVY